MSTREPVAVSKEEAAAMLNVKIDTVYRMMRTDKLPYITVGRYQRIPLKDINDMIEAAREEARAIREGGSRYGSATPRC